MNTQFTQFINFNYSIAAFCLAMTMRNEWEWNRSDPISHTFHRNIYNNKNEHKNENEQSLRDMKVYAVKSHTTILQPVIISIYHHHLFHEEKHFRFVLNEHEKLRNQVEAEFGMERKGKSEKSFSDYFRCFFDSSMAMDKVWQFQDWKYFVSSSDVLFSFSFQPISTLPTTQQKYNIFFFYSFHFVAGRHSTTRCWGEKANVISDFFCLQHRRWDQQYITHKLLMLWHSLLPVLNNKENIPSKRSNQKATNS